MVVEVFTGHSFLDTQVRKRTEEDRANFCSLVHVPSVTGEESTSILDNIYVVGLLATDR